MQYTIIGGTGNTGSLIAQALLEAGHAVRILSRTPEKQAALVAKGASTVQGSITNATDLTAAFEGSTAAYLMVLPDTQTEDYYAYGKTVADAYVAALQNSPNITHMVVLSSVGTQLPGNRGIVENLEERLHTAFPERNIRVLRAAYFMENLMGSAYTAKHMGTVFGTQPADMPMAMVATKDIAHMAAEHLRQLDFEGYTVEYVLGPHEMTMEEAARHMADAVGKPVAYQQVPYEAMHGTMMQQWGISRSMADAYEVFLRNMEDNRVMEGVERTAANTTATKLEHLMPAFKGAYDAV